MTVWELVIPAPYVKPVKKRKTGKMFQRGPWLNSNDNDHFRTLHPIKKGWIANAQEAYAASGIPKFTGRVQIDAYVIKMSGQNYDPGNWYPTFKAIIDGLVRVDMLPDDNKDILEGPYPHHGGKGPNSIRLTIKEL